MQCCHIANFVCTPTQLIQNVQYNNALSCPANEGFVCHDTFIESSRYIRNLYMYMYLANDVDSSSGSCKTSQIENDQPLDVWPCYYIGGSVVTPRSGSLAWSCPMGTRVTDGFVRGRRWVSSGEKALDSRRGPMLSFSTKLPWEGGRVGVNIWGTYTTSLVS